MVKLLKIFTKSIVSNNIKITTSLAINHHQVTCKN